MNFYTRFGETVKVSGSGLFGDWKQPLTLNARENGDWEVTLIIPAKTADAQYKYFVEELGGTTKWEGGANRVARLSEVSEGQFMEIRDSWRTLESPESTYYDTSLFREVIFHRPTPTPLNSLNKEVAPAASQLVRFEIVSTPVGPSNKVYVSGSNAILGNWDPKKALPLSDAHYPQWTANVVIPENQLNFNYKYLIVSKEGDVVEWEGGPNRFYSSDNTPTPQGQPIPTSKAVVLNDGDFRSVTQWRGVGVALPVFSIRSKTGLGVGEFLDLKLIVDWAVKTGQNIIQILPINDTTVFKDYRDSYPYSAVSVFALHPLYIRIEAITTDKDILKEVDEKRTKLNSLKQIDYVEVMNLKTTLLQRIYEKAQANLASDKQFQQFVEENKDWLAPYAAFCQFRDEFKTSDHQKWKGRESITKAQIDEIVSPKGANFKTVQYTYWVQYHLHLQLLEASQYAKTNRVGLKGDLPIGVNRASVDTWVEPHLFRMNMSTGAPPDAFSDDGQNWGFPTYAWEEMAKDNYAWWRRRLGQMAKYFHAFRIDHILGFFRIWEIPGNAVTGLLGHFNPSIPVWKTELTSNGVWDVDRLTKPYIRWHVLQQFFGEQASHVASTYLQSHSTNIYELKPEWSCEKSIREKLPQQDKGLEAGLFKLVQNVILVRDDQDENRFYPRIDMQKTSSFADLEPHLRQVLHTLYISYFYERQEDLWSQIGRTRLPVIRSCTKMLVCGEDLGMVPKCVPPVLDQIGILGLRIQRMPADNKIEFYHPDTYDYLTVCTTSSHDMSTLRGWWEEDRNLSQRFYNTTLGMSGSSPFFCESYVSQAVLNQHLYSKSMLAIFPIQDLMGISGDLSAIDPREQKINEPSNPTHYWRFRLHISSEDLLNKYTDFDSQLKNLIQTSGRKI